MPTDDIDPIQDAKAASKKRHWKPDDYCPLPLRTVVAVVEDAKPRPVAGGGFRWWQAGGDWWGVDPPTGVLPAEVIARLSKSRSEVYVTAEEAMRDLREACEGLTLDGFGRATA